MKPKDITSQNSLVPNSEIDEQNEKMTCEKNFINQNLLYGDL